MSEIVFKEFSSPVAVWNYFLKAENSQSAKCKLCKAIIKTSGRSTTVLHVHLKSKHKIDTKAQTAISDNVNSANTARSATASTTIATTSLCSQTSKKQKITDYFRPGNSLEIKISRMICKDGLPFRVFSSSSDLQELFIGSGYSLPSSPNSIKSMVMNYGSHLKMVVTRELVKLKHQNLRFTLTFDEWTS